MVAQGNHRRDSRYDKINAREDIGTCVLSCAHEVDPITSWCSMKKEVQLKCPRSLAPSHMGELALSGLLVRSLASLHVILRYRKCGQHGAIVDL